MMAAPSTQPATSPAAQGVFLSYSSKDRGIALKLKNGLERLGVAVRIDLQALQPGQDIREFIVESIRATGATVLVVSQASLVSDWVAVEVGTSLQDSELWDRRAFVACYIDEGFLDVTFRLRATETIEAKLAEIDGLIPIYAQKGLDPVDLNSRKTRLFKLKNNLGELLRHLEGSLCLDIRNEHFEENLGLLARQLRPLAPASPEAVLSGASNIEQRRQEVYDLVASGDAERALKRVMDFVKDFSEDKAAGRKIVAMMMSFQKLESQNGRPLQEIGPERERIVLLALELVDETVDRRVA